LINRHAILSDIIRDAAASDDKNALFRIGVLVKSERAFVPIVGVGPMIFEVVAGNLERSRPFVTGLAGMAEAGVADEAAELAWAEALVDAGAVD
jgi:hypothetical protein